MATIIKRIYEIQDTGKGLIDSITEDNLLLIYDLTQNLQGFEDVLVHNSNLTFGHIINSAQQFNISTDIADFIIDQFSANDYPFYPLNYIGIGRGNLFTESSFAIFDEVMEFRDTRNNKGVSYAGDYEANFTARSLITKQYLQAQIAAIPPPTGAETKIVNGTNTTVSGTGTTGSPYQIAVPTPDGSETKVTAGTGITVSGTGTTGSPYVINSTASVKATSVVLTGWTKDVQSSQLTFLPIGSTILSATPSLVCLVANSGFVAGDTTTVGAPELADSGGRPDQGIGIQYNNSDATVVRVLVNSEIAIMAPWSGDGGVNNEISIGDESQWGIKITILYI